MAYAGFDASGFPGLSKMQYLRTNTDLEWCGFYFKAPSHPDGGWMGQRGSLTAMGWGLAPIFVGQQVTGPGSHMVTAAQGKIDGNDAATMMRQSGFPPGSFVFLDLENGPPFNATQQAYVAAWVNTVKGGGFGPGVYCSYLMGAEVHALCPEARIWVFHVRSTADHIATGGTFPAPDPKTSGYAGAIMWQREMAAKITVPGGLLLVDLNTSAVADPSAPATQSPSVPAVPGKPEGQAMDTATVVTAVQAAAPAPAAVAVAPASSVDSRVQWGTHAEQLEEAFAAVLEPAAITAYQAFAPWYIQMVVGPAAVKKAIDQALLVVENATKGQTLEINTQNDFIAAVIRIVNSDLPSWSKWLVSLIEPLVISELISLKMLPANFKV